MVFQDPYHEIYQDSLVITLSEAIRPRLQLFSLLCCKNISTTRSTRGLPSSGCEPPQGDHQGVPEPLVLAAVQPPDDPPEPAVLRGGEHQHARV